MTCIECIVFPIEYIHIQFSWDLFCYDFVIIFFSLQPIHFILLGLYYGWCKDEWKFRRSTAQSQWKNYWSTIAFVSGAIPVVLNPLNALISTSRNTYRHITHSPIPASPIFPSQIAMTHFHIRSIMANPCLSHGLCYQGWDTLKRHSCVDMMCSMPMSKVEISEHQVDIKTHTNLHY